MKQNKIFLSTFYSCEPTEEKPVSQSFQHVNCKYWDVNQQSCKTFCSLNVFDSPTALQCATCEKREAIVGITIKQQPIIPQTTFVDKTVSYVKAESSQMINGKVSEKVFNKRKAICMDCSYRTNPKPESETIGWCKGGCGCVIGNPRAALSQKLYMPTVSCPQKKWAPDNGEGFKISDALDSLKGIKNSIQSLFKKDK